MMRYAIGCFIGGVGAGFGIGVLVTKKKLEAQYLAMANEEIASAREYYTEKMNNMCGEPCNDPNDKDEDARPEKKPDIKLVKPTNSALDRSDVNANTYEQAKRNYNLISRKPQQEEYNGEDYEDEMEDESLDAAGMSEEESAAAAEPGGDEPYVISSDEYAEENPEYDKTSLYYYRVDDVLCSEDGDDVIDDIDATVGYDAMNMLDMQSMVWVRNEYLKIEYEIISVNSSYAEQVRHIATTPRERYEKKKRRDDYEE